MRVAERVFHHFVIWLAVAAGLFQLLQFSPDQKELFALYIVLTATSGWFRVGVPTVLGTVPIGFIFILAALAQFPLPQTIVIGVVGTVAYLFRSQGESPDRRALIFQSAVMVLGIVSANGVLGYTATVLPSMGRTGGLPLAAVTLFLSTIFPLAAEHALSERAPLRTILHRRYLWAFPYYLAGSAVAGLLVAMSSLPMGNTVLILGPVLFMLHRSYVLQMEAFQSEKKQAEELSSLQLGMVEALALALEAKDSGTRKHLNRLVTFSLGLGKAMGLREEELHALRTAAILHDIGKIAVPDHILRKAGPLTPEEFDRLKVHPAVGADIIERAKLPLPVAPIVRAHRERWDGSGYPYRLKGKEIPLGARILAVADCLEALSSDRRYRAAKSLDEAMQVLETEAGSRFDPEIVAILKSQYREFEAQASEREAGATTAVQSRDGLVPSAPGWGLGEIELSAPTTPSFLEPIAEARQEEKLVNDLNELIGSTLVLEEWMGTVHRSIASLLPCTTFVIYAARENRLHAELIFGEFRELFTGFGMGIGEGVSGYAANLRRPIRNAEMGFEPLKPDAAFRKHNLQSILAVPLESNSGVVGVVTVYSHERAAFSRDHQRLLMAIAPRLAQALENALRYTKVETLAANDYLTGLPNAASLQSHLQSEIARCSRTKTELTVLLCDLDGFKGVNDRFGHLAGNKVLQIVAQGLKEHCREYDLVARLGGDEFVAVLPGLAGEDIRTKRARFCSVATKAGMEVSGGEDTLALSVGEASYPEDGLSAEELLAKADERMYQDKATRKLLRAGGLANTAHGWLAASSDY